MTYWYVNNLAPPELVFLAADNIPPLCCCLQRPNINQPHNVCAPPQVAKKMGPNLHERFAIFVREQEHRQKAAVATSGEESTDLVSYVEFQRNYRSDAR